MHEIEPSDGVVTLSPLRLDDVEAHLGGEDELLVRWLNGGPGTREGVEAYVRHCREQWDGAGRLRAFGIRVGTDGVVLAGTIDLRFARDGDGDRLAPGQVNVPTASTRPGAGVDWQPAQSCWRPGTRRARARPRRSSGWSRGTPASAAVARRAGSALGRPRHGGEDGAPFDWYLRDLRNATPWQQTAAEQP
ncbi:GNAT family N-acetyltransferase [Streptacidiphilus monticola]|uniref:GNAT family N-acetyltransferase n=1 Tax=Streptacidiphilus monticola TaxID=2161674 RepID=A0ABW1G393_9ACTN